MSISVEDLPEPTESTASKRFRLQSKLFLLTYPRCSTDKAVANSNIHSHEWTVPLLWSIVGHEKHEDGSDHLHVALMFQDKLKVSQPNFFDFIAGKHGNYKGADLRNRKTIERIASYVTKEEDYLVTGVNLDDLINSRKKPESSKLSSKIAESVSSGCTLEEVEKIDPGFFMMNFQKISTYHAWKQARLAPPLKPWIPFPMVSMLGLPEYTIEIMLWLNRNLFQERPYGAKDLYLHGPTGIGKTSLTLKLATFSRIYYIPTDEGFMDYEDGLYDLAMIDEFKSSTTIQFLNKWCQGAPQNFKRKHGTQGIKRKHIPTIILSNYSLEECYPDPYGSRLSTLQRRLEIVHATGPINIPWPEEPTITTTTTDLHSID